MKKLIFFLWVLCVAIVGNAQTNRTLPELFTVSESQPLDVTTFGTAQKMKGILENPMYLEVRKVRFADLARVSASNLSDNAGYFRFAIPASSATKKMEDVLVAPVHIESLESGDYTYFADLLTGQNGKGSLILTREKGEIFGSILLEDRVFRIEQTEAGEQVLIELNQKLLNSPVSCGTSEGNRSTRATAEVPELLNHHCNSRNVRVLVLFTDRANNVSNPGQLATTLMNELRSALSNSRIYSSTLRFQLVGTERIGFRETQNDPEGDLGRLVLSNDLNNRRQNARADLVVVLTDGNYLIDGGQVLGIATLDEYSQADVGHVAMVEADAGNVTFAHEVGHLMGCRHDTDDRPSVPNLSNTAKGHSWFYRNWFLGPKKYQKSVVASGLTEGSRVLHFSNPDVKAHDKARDNTGTSTRNNFVQLGNAAHVVPCYDDFEDMTVSISGPVSGQVGELITLSASVSNCASRTYRWEVSSDGFHYSFLGSGSSVSYRLHPVYGSDRFTFRLTVTCSDGQSRTTFRTVYRNDCDDIPHIPCTQQLESKSDLPGSDMQQRGPAILVYPNPSDREVTLTLGAPAGSDIAVEAYSMLSGKSYRLYHGRSKAERNELQLNVSKLDQGLYQLVIMLDGSEFGMKKLIIQR